ncbi:MAG: glycogen debranching protein GlgX [Ornithinimicrobium sp.]
MPVPSVDSSRPLETPPPMGVTLTQTGAHVAVLATHADQVELCLFDTGGSGDSERRVPLTQSRYGVWWDHVPDMRAGQRYGFRAHGPWSPREGHRHNPNKLLLDPYARAVEGEVTWAPEIYGHRVDQDWRGDGNVRDDRDSAAYTPRSVALADTFDWGDDALPRTPWSRTVIYEAHVKGLTMQHPDVPPRLRGTYAALGHPAILDHLRRLGVSALELLPIHAFTAEPHLQRTGGTNYWGYNTVGFFAPHAAYAAAENPGAVVAEVKTAIKALHAAGIEVILDVVYNHTCEQSAAEGATLSWRGLDNRNYYRLDDRGRDIDVTGCGNTIDTSKPPVAGMVLDSLRHWVQDFHIDGFRFDLAPALARGRAHSVRQDHALLVAMRTDPVLSAAKLIAEPWDVGVHGWQTGHFPPPFAEWNDRFRDTVRSFWGPDVARDHQGLGGGGVRDLATRVAGSRDFFADNDRGPIASINLITAHDGFTLADLTAYEHKHNEANGEHNRDGHGDNRSWNHGVEGESDDESVVAARGATIRASLATLLCAAGVPMLTAGDEFGRSQQGNNNAYCQDNELSWVSWDLAAWQQELLVDVQKMIALRQRYAVLRPAHFPTFNAVPGRVRLRWFDESGEVMRERQWVDPHRRVVQALFDTEHDGSPDAPVLVVFDGSATGAEVVPPAEATGVSPDAQIVLRSAPTPPVEHDVAAVFSPLSAELPASPAR